MQAGVSIQMLDVMPMQWSLPGYCHNYLRFYQLSNSNLFTHCLLSFSREATSETYAPRSSSSYICLRSTFPLRFYLDLLNQKYKNTLLRIIFIYFIWHSIYQSTAIYLASTCQFWCRYPKGIDNPFNTSGCEVFLFVCQSCLRCVAWWSYWFDTLVS